MAAIKFSKQSIQPNPMEVDYWVDITSNPYGGNIKYHNGYDWVDLLNAKGKPVNLDAYYNKLQMNQMLAGKASVESVNSKVDDTEVADVIKNIEFKDRGDEGVEMVVLKYDGMTVGVTLPTASNTTSGIITNKSFKDLVKQNQLQGVYSEMYDKLSEIRQQYQRKLKAGKNIQIDENNTIHAVGDISLDWEDVYNKPNFDQLFATVALAIQSESNRAKNAEQQLSARITDHVDVVEGKLELKADANNVYTKDQIDEKISGIYKIKGSRTFQDLPTSGNSIGDVYNITNNFALDGVEYPLGTNVVYTATGWDALAGIFDSTEIENKVDEIDTKVDEEVIRAKEKELELDKKFDDYLPLSGGVLTRNQNSPILYINNTHSSPYMAFLYKGVNIGAIKYDSTTHDIYGSVDYKGWLRILHEGNYSDYALPLTGGTINGRLQINRSDDSHTLVLNTEKDSPAIAFKSGGDTVTRLVADKTSKYLCRTNIDWSEQYRIWDSGNFNPDNYLPLTGGTISSKEKSPLKITGGNYGEVSIGVFKDGNEMSVFGYAETLGTFMWDNVSHSRLYIRNNKLFFTPSAYAAAETIWHSGNDGSGSGLDADTLDGKHLNKIFSNEDWASISGVTDANQQLFGAYYFGGATQNMPSTYGQLIAFNGLSGEYGGMQLFSHSNKLHYRHHWNDEWGEWKQIAFTDYNGFYDLNTGVEILADSDLNDYNTVGTYFIHNDSIAKTIKNVPLRQAGKIVNQRINGATSHIILTYLIDNGIKEYSRLYNSSGWSNWSITKENLNNYNAPTATKLQTPVKLWGNDFDGSSDISGDIKFNSPSVTIARLGDDSNYHSIFDFNHINKTCNINYGQYVNNNLQLFGKDIKLYNNGLTNLIVRENGNVGIGTSNPIRKFVISDGGRNGIEISPYDTDYNLIAYNRETNEYTPFTLYCNNFGIGTTKPQYTLEVNGNASFKNYLYLGGKRAITDDNGKDYLIFGTHTKNTYVRGLNAYFQIGENYENTVSIVSNGNMGIGTTDPKHKLDVIGAIKTDSLNITRSSDGAAAFNISNVDGTHSYQITNNGGEGSITFATNGNSTTVERFRIHHDGNIGIGIIHPSDKLHIYSDTNSVIHALSSIDIKTKTVGNGVGPNIKLSVADTDLFGCGGEIQFFHAGALTSLIKGEYTHYAESGTNKIFGGLSFYTKSIDTGEFIKCMVVNPKGFVGIGIDSPRYKLHVTGQIRSDSPTGSATVSPGGIELHHGTPFIDFHFNNATDDYTSRIIEHAAGKLKCIGSWDVTNSVGIGDSLFVQDQIAMGDLVDWYGVSWSEDSSDPTCTRIGNMALHRSLPILSAMKGYTIANIRSATPELITPLTDDWEMKYFINSNDQYPFDLGMLGHEVFVKIPEFWYIDDYEPSTKTHNLKISQTAKAGWCHHKEAYVGAYEGFKYEELNNNYRYRSCKNSIPTVSLSRETLRPLARANGYEDEYKWNIYTYEEHRAICHLFLVEYATRNSQAEVNTALTSDGFKQGGLGSGCTTGSVKINGVDTYSFIPTGTTDSLGNGSGQVAYTVTLTDADGNEIGTVTRYANRYRGIENPFGHIWKHVDDIVNVYNAGTTYKIVYKCNKPEHFATNKNAKYKPLCSFPGGSKMQGWSKEIKATINCDFFKYSVGGSETTYWCDYNYDNDDTSEHCLLIGGRSGSVGDAGLFYFRLSDGVGYSYVHLGSRLTYLPWAE